MLNLEPADEDGYSLPPITPTPRTVTSQPYPLTPRPLSSRVSCARMGQAEKPRRSLKQASRGHREWTSSLLDCRDDGNFCCYTCLCPCVTLWTIADRTGENCCVAWLPWTTAAMRTKIRTLGGIKGSVTGDYCTSCCCPQLVICQMAREVDHMIVQPEEFVKPVI